MILASGEIQPRVRTPAGWAVEPVAHKRSFGAINFTVLTVYLLAMVGVGIYFARRNRDTNDYFRGGQRVVWWAAGCSIFATMLSSITYMAIPAKAYAQDLVYLIGNLMIPAVAPVAIYLALPFFPADRRDQRIRVPPEAFNMRCGCCQRIVHAVPRLPHGDRHVPGVAGAGERDLAESGSMRAIMGVLSVIYCTIGGIEAVI